MEELLKILSDFFIDEYIDFEKMDIYVSSFGINIFISKKNGISMNSLERLKFFLGKHDIEIRPQTKNKITIGIYIFRIFW